MLPVEPRVVLPDDVISSPGLEGIESWIERAQHLGYGGMVLDLTGQKDTAALARRVKDRESGLEGFLLGTRVDITIENTSQVKRLQNLRQRMPVDVISLVSNDPDVLVYCAKDSRIDLIQTASALGQDIFTSGITSLASQTGIFIELPFKPLYSSQGAGRSRVIRAMAKIIETCKEKRASMILSGEVTRMTDMKVPYQKIITVASLTPMSRQDGKTAVVDNTRALLDNARNKFTTDEARL